jgi:hypothetical protein
MDFGNTANNNDVKINIGNTNNCNISFDKEINILSQNNIY